MLPYLPPELVAEIVKHLPFLHRAALAVTERKDVRHRLGIPEEMCEEAISLVRWHPSVWL